MQACLMWGCFTLMIGEQGRRSRSEETNSLGSHPRLLYLPGFSLNFICEFPFAYELSSVATKLSLGQEVANIYIDIAADAWMGSVSMCDENFSSWPGRTDDCCAHIEPLPHWKCLFRPHQHVCLLLCTVWELRLLSHQALLKWQLSSADSQFHRKAANTTANWDEELGFEIQEGEKTRSGDENLWEALVQIAAKLSKPIIL